MTRCTPWLVFGISCFAGPLLGQSSPGAQTFSSQTRTTRPAKESASCEELSSLPLSDGKITLARIVGADQSTTPADGVGPVAPAAIERAYCRVSAALTPTRDSEITVEIWMPIADWNGKFQALGNGAFSGNINYPSMRAALNEGYATAATDTGHTGDGARWSLGHPEKTVDFAWRAVHLMTIVSKAIIAAYYHGGPRFSYWNGCSAGGRQGMKEAQKFPADFDGIIAGAPGLDWTGRAAQAVRVAKLLEAAKTARLLQPQRQLLHKTVLEKCDAIDGVKDGLIQNPKRCKFDPTVLLCTESTGPDCLTSAQIETARLMYSTAVNPKTQREITGLEPGSELGWTDLGWTMSARGTGLDQFRFLVFKDPNWDVQKFNFDTDIVRAEETDDGVINALDPNLKPFLDRGGKLIQYHGWSDPQISPGNSTQYYERVLELSGGPEKVHGSYRLFMAPGMAHCGAGEGPNTFDMLRAMEQWVENGKAPDLIIASHSSNGAVDRTRPLCPYPLIAAYKGTGSTDDAANFACAAK